MESQLFAKRPARRARCGKQFPPTPPRRQPVSCRGGNRGFSVGNRAFFHEIAHFRRILLGWISIRNRKIQKPALSGHRNNTIIRPPRRVRTLQPGVRDTLAASPRPVPREPQRDIAVASPFLHGLRCDFDQRREDVFENPAVAGGDLHAYGHAGGQRHGFGRPPSSKRRRAAA